MSIITQLIPSDHICNVNLEKKIIIQNANNNIKNVEMLNTHTNKKYIFKVMNENTEWYFIIPKYFDPGYYLVNCIFKNETISPDDYYTCYPCLKKSSNDKIPINGGKYTIYGSGFTTQTKLIGYYGNEEKDIKYEMINSEQIICTLNKYDGNGKSVTIKCISNGVESMSMLYLYYEEPYITSISNENIPLNGYKIINIHGKNFSENIEDIKINVENIVIKDEDIISSSSSSIEFKMQYQGDIGVVKLNVEIYGIKSNYIHMNIIPSLVSSSDSNIIYLSDENNSEFIIKGYGINEFSKVYINDVYNSSCKYVSENELLINIREITEPQEISIYVKTSDYKSEPIIYKLINHNIEKLSCNTGFINETSNIIIHGFGLNNDISIVIEKDDKIIEKIDTISPHNDYIQFTFPKLNIIGDFYIYIIKDNISSIKHKYTQIPKSAICYPKTFPLTMNEPGYVSGHIELEGIVEIENIKFELLCEELDFFVKPKLTKKTEKENKSIFSFKLKELNIISKMVATLEIYGRNININNIAFVPKITKIKPTITTTQDEIEIEIEGYGFSKDIDIYFNKYNLKYDIDEYMTYIKTEVFKPKGVGPVLLEIKMNDVFEINEYIFIKPNIEKIEFPNEIKANEKPYFYLKCNEITEQMDLIVKINNINCKYSIQNDNIIIYTDNYEKEIKCAKLYLSCAYNNLETPFYVNCSFTYPQFIYIDNNYGFCTKENTLIIKGYSIDSNTKVKLNGNITNATFLYDSFIITIPPTNHAEQYEIITLNDEEVPSINKIIYFTIPEIIELSCTKGFVRGGNFIKINGIGFTNNIIAVWFDDVKISENIVIDENTITCKVPCASNNICKKINIRIETMENHMSNALEYQYIPQIDNQSIKSGFISGEYNMTLYGYGFDICNKIIFDENIIVDFLEHTNTSITFVVPPIDNNENIKLKLKCNEDIESNDVEFTYEMPQIKQIEPNYGYVRGGENILISGEGLFKDIQLFVNDKLTNYTIVDKNFIQYISPESSVKTNVEIHFEFKNKQIEGKLKYTYNPQKIFDIEPKSGLLRGGYQMTINGEGFLSENVCVNIGNKIIQKTDFIKHNDNIIEFIVPSNQIAGETPIYVLVNNVKSENNCSFFYISKINSISLDNTPVNTKIPITIQGDGFTGMSIVKMGTNIIHNPSFDAKTGSITVITPLFNMAQTLPITVTTNNYITNEIMFTVNPIIKNINPDPWIAEDMGFLYVLGEGFSSSTLGCIMGIDKTEPKIIEPIKISSDTLIFAMPYVKQSGEINLAIGTSSITNDSWLARKIMVYPKITTLSEKNGSITGGNNIEISGKGFNKYSKVIIDEKIMQDNMVQFVNENTLILTIPPSTGLKDIKICVKCNELTSNYVRYTYAPSIKEIKPNFSTINGGSTAIISGEGFNDKSVVIFNNKPIIKTNTVYDEERSTIAIIVPQHFEVENVNIKIITNDIESSNSVKFYYTPIIDNISITNTSVNKQEIVQINGDGFCTNSVVKLGDKFIEPQNIIKVSNDHIQFKLPIIDQQCSKEVRIFTNAIPTSITKSITFAAELSNISPNIGRITGGTTVNIFGYGFNNDIIIYFNDVNINYTIISKKQIAIITPENGGVIGTNKIMLQCSKFMTNLSTNFVCYPVISYMTQKYIPAEKKMHIVIYGHGFTNNAVVIIGNINGIIPMYNNNVLKIEIDEKYETQIIKPLLVNVVVNGLTTHDEIYYSNIPHLNSLNTNVGYMNGGYSISIYGAGFEKDTTYVLIEEFNVQIKPYYITSSVIKIKMPKTNMVEKINLTVVSNNIKSTSLPFTYSPSINSASENICNAGEEMRFKIYGDGFENGNTEVFIKEHEKCKLTRFVNNKIIEVKLPNITKPGGIYIYVSVFGIMSFDILKFEIRPLIISIKQDYININGGFVEISGIGMHNASIVTFKCGENTYECSNIINIENNQDKNNYEVIKVHYDELQNCKKIMKDENLEYLELEIIVKNNNVESIPHKFLVKNIEYEINIEGELVKAINICNNYLLNNQTMYNYDIIDMYSHELTIMITQLIMKICELPNKYMNPEAEYLLLNGFKKIAKKNHNDVIVEYIIQKMVRTMIDMLYHGTNYQPITTIIPTPFTIFVPTNKDNTRKNEYNYDYLFSDCIEYKNDKPVYLLYANELSKAITYKNMNEDNIEFMINEEILNNICNRFNNIIMQKKFILINKNGMFKGSNVSCPKGNIADLFIYKITSSLIGIPEKTSSDLNIESIKNHVMNYEKSKEKSLGIQLKNILSKPETLKTIYDQLNKKKPEIAQKKNNNFTQMPFQKGDKIGIMLFISEKINKTNKSKDIFYKSCDPDIYDKSNPIDYLLNHDATEIRATRDCYEITLG
jgi:hypothetical protein